MRWAVVDQKTRVVKRVVESEETPTVDRGEIVVKGHDESCAVDRVWNGWTFEEVIL